MTTPPPTVVRPAQVTVAAALVAVEGLAALAFGVLEIGEIRIFRAAVGVGVAILMMGYAVLLLAVARGLLHGRRWSRAPAVATQLILLPVGWSFRSSPTTVVGITMLGVAVVTLVAILHPRSTAYLVPAEQDDPGGA